MRGKCTISHISTFCKHFALMSSGSGSRKHICVNPNPEPELSLPIFNLQRVNPGEQNIRRVGGPVKQGYIACNVMVEGRMLDGQTEEQVDGKMISQIYIIHIVLYPCLASTGAAGTEHLLLHMHLLPCVNTPNMVDSAGILYSCASICSSSSIASYSSSHFPDFRPFFLSWILILGNFLSM